MPTIHRVLACVAATCCLAGLGSPALAQGTASREFETRFAAVWDLLPANENAATVSNLVITREQAQFELTSGQVTFLAPMDGRIVGAVWQGTGHFKFDPGTQSEQDRLLKLLGSPRVDLPITELVMFFSDSISEALRAQAKGPNAGPITGMRSSVRQALDYVGDESDRQLDNDLMALMLNGAPSGIFYAFVTRQSGAQFMFASNPNVREGVRILSKSKGMGYLGVAEGAVRTPGASEKLIPSGERRQGDVEIRHYVIETTMPNTITGDVNFQTRAEVTLEADQPVTGWVPFGLFQKLRVDSASWSDGSAADVYKPKNSDAMWVKLPKRLTPGDSLVLRLAYHGDVTERFADFFYIRTSTAWYPQPMEERSKATFDLTYHVPRAYTLVSVGDLKDSSATGSMVTTRWVSPAPMRNASFNLGIFKATEVNNPPAPDVTVLWNELAHREFAQGGAQEKGMDKRVGADVSAALQFYRTMFGELGVGHFYATEIPDLHGEAFPGFINLSYQTFISTNRSGADEIFRAHEVAHQWWGIGVDFASYRDQWLSEGMSNFSGLWYLQVVRKEPKPYFNQLRIWKTSIIDRSNDAGPISLGFRVSTDRNPNDYQVIVYQKGAWVMHMLRTLMINLKTMQEDRFQNMMKEFFTTYDGRTASTDDFQQMVEKHTGQPMGWFFDQWVRGTQIPTYKVAWAISDPGTGVFKTTVKVTQEGVAKTFKMYVPVTLTMTDGSVLRTRMLVQGPESTVTLPDVASKPKTLTFNDFEGVLATVAEVSGPN